MNKSYRHGQILKLIRAKRIYTQEELARELGELGVPATQVTLSRDIHELRLLKTPEGYQQMRAEPGGPDLDLVAGEFLQDVRQAENLLVLKTSPGHAGSIAVALDQAGWDEVLGTIAGDDTVLVVAAGAAAADAVRVRLMEYLQA